MMNKVAVVSSSYYKDIIKNIIWGINEYIDDKFEIDTFSVPGSWDIVYKINSLSNEYDKFIAVGVICKGETDHYEYISTGVSNGLMNITINKDVYIGNCILNVHNLIDAEKRSIRDKDSNKGVESAVAINKLFN